MAPDEDSFETPPGLESPSSSYAVPFDVPDGRPFRSPSDDDSDGLSYESPVPMMNSDESVAGRTSADLSEDSEVSNMSDRLYRQGPWRNRDIIDPGRPVYWSTFCSNCHKPMNIPERLFPFQSPSIAMNLEGRCSICLTVTCDDCKTKHPRAPEGICRQHQRDGYLDGEWVFALKGGMKLYESLVWAKADSRGTRF